MRVLKWIAYVFGGLVVLAAIAMVVFYFMSERKLGNNFAITPDAVTIPTDEASIARGKHIVEAVSGCGTCHTANLGGEMFIDEPDFFQIAAPNLTSGEGGVGASYSDADWVSAIRHGVAADGRELLFMTSQWYNYLSDEDLGALIAYLKTVSPVDQTFSERAPAFIPTRILLALGVLPFAPELIAQNEPRTSPEAAVSVDYGAYLVNVAVCHECHGENLAGGAGEGAPIGPNLTRGGELAAWREEDFINTMRTGVTPGGRTLSEEMPWMQYGNMTDDELKAIYMYLQSLEPLPSNASGT